MRDRKELERFASKKYRDGYLQSRVRGFIAYQIQALRGKLGLTQEAFAEATGKKQSTISRLEDMEYGKVSVQTLLDIACASDVALVVKFVSYPDFLNQTKRMDDASLKPRTIHETLKDMRQDQPSLQGAYRRFLELHGNERGKSAQDFVANDNGNDPQGDASALSYLPSPIRARAIGANPI